MTYLRRETIERIDWPVRSPDLNLIEHLRDMLQAGISSRVNQPRSLQELGTALQEEWASIQQNRIRYGTRSTCVLLLDQLQEMNGSNFIKRNQRLLLRGIPYLGTVAMTAWLIKELLACKYTFEDKGKMSYDNMLGHLSPKEVAELEKKIEKQRAENLKSLQTETVKWDNPDISLGVPTRARPNPK